MELISVWIAVAAVLLLGLLAKLLDPTSSSKQQLPPGPPKLPLIGNLHQLNKGGQLFHVALTKMAQNYGGIMTVWFGAFRPYIVVSDRELVWEVMVTKASDFSDRTLPWLTRIFTADWNTLATSDLGPHWQTLRKGLQFTTLNPQTISAQTHLQQKDVADLISSFEKEASSNNGLVKPLPKLRKLAIRLVGRFCFGPEFPNDDLFVERMDCAIEDLIIHTGQSGLVHLFAVTRYIPGLWRPFKELEKVKERIKELLRPFLYTHDKPTSPNCYLSFLLSQGYSEDIVILNLFELFMLAVDSTASTVAWALAFIIHDDKVQEKMFEEVSTMSEKLGVSVEDVSKMEYLHAVAKETLRMRPIAPVMPHRAARDSELKGMKVRKGTPVMVNFYSVLYDERVWKEPNKFMPERFMRSSCSLGDYGGQDVEAMERSFVSFGVGRRNCPGMELAKIHIAVTLANLVKRFKWCSAVEGQLPDLSEDLTFVLMMKTPLEARVVPR